MQCRCVLACLCQRFAAHRDCHLISSHHVFVVGAGLLQEASDPFRKYLAAESVQQVLLDNDVFLKEVYLTYAQKVQQFVMVIAPSACVKPP